MNSVISSSDSKSVTFKMGGNPEGVSVVDLIKMKKKMERRDSGSNKENNRYSDEEEEEDEGEMHLRTVVPQLSRVGKTGISSLFTTHLYLMFIFLTSAKKYFRKQITLPVYVRKTFP